jgi:putative Mg2+ transporter-C (MgtC) family protein
VSISPAEVLIRLALAVAFGVVIGFERQWHHKHAGVKTHTLVCLGSTGFALVSVLGMGPNSAPTQLAVGVVTGIGFIGGGVIMHRGASIQGINTAATLWATASLGLALGPGFYFLSTALFVAILVCQLALRFLDNWVEDRSLGLPEDPTHRLAVSFSPLAEAAVHKAVSEFLAEPGLVVCRSSQTRAALLQWDLELGLARPRYGAFEKLGRELAALPDVQHVEWGVSPEAGEP